MLGKSPYWNEEPEATNAIVHIGAKASPYLVKWLAYPIELNPPPWRQKLLTIYTKMPVWFQSKWLEKLVKGKPPGTGRPTRNGNGYKLLSDRVLGTEYAFHILGPTAKNAIPDLKRIALSKDSSLWWSKETATGILARFGVEALPALISILTNGSPLQTAVYGIHDLGTNARAAIPVLVQTLRNPYLAFEACEALYDLDPDIATKAGLVVPIGPPPGGKHPPEVLPGLLTKLSDQSPRSRRLALDMIVNVLDVQTNGLLVVPPLRNALNDPDLLVRMRATNYLRYIAPEYLEKAADSP